MGLELADNQLFQEQPGSIKKVQAKSSSDVHLQVLQLHWFEWFTGKQPKPG